MTKTLTPAEASRKAVADALEVEAAWRNEVQVEQARVVSIERAWDRGDDTITSEEMTAAKVAVARAERLHSAAVNSRKKAERAVINEDDGLAVVVGQVLTDLLPGVPVELHTTKPEAPDEDTLPVLHVIQTKAPKRDTITGSVAGSVEVVGHFPSWTERLRPLDRQRLGDALDRANVRVAHEVRDRAQVIGNRAEHRTDLEIRSAIEPMPVITHQPRASAASYLGQALCHWITRPVVAAKMTDYDVTKVEEVEGVRHTTARLSIRLTARDRNTQGRNSAYTIASEEIENAVGQHFTSLGRVQTATASRTEDGLTATLVLTSRTSV